MYFNRFIVVGFLVSFIDISLSIFDYQSQMQEARHAQKFPWAGILQVNDANNEREAVTGIVMIHKRTALGNADAISKIDRRNIWHTTKAVFYNDLTRWKSIVLDYVIHPDHKVKTANTIALLILNVGRRVPTFLLTPISLPKERKNYDKSRRVYSIGFIDKKDGFLKVITKMVPYDSRKCFRFYKKEGMDLKYVWPLHYDCFIDPNKKGSCLYDAGMALATNDTGKWVLLGISTLGPGCSLPSRFINLLPYKAWITRHMTRSSIEIGKKIKIVPTTTKLKENYHRKHNARKSNKNNGIKPYLRQNLKKPRTGIVQDTYVDKDTEIMKIYANDSLVLNTKFAGEMELVYASKDKECKRDKWTTLVYRESGWYKVGWNTGKVIFSVSIQDLRYKSITCIKSLVKCESKSSTQLEFHKGFQQDDINKFQKIVPVYDKKHGQTVPPRVEYLKDGYKLYRTRDVVTLSYKFYFYETAEIEIMFYGSRFQSTTLPTTTTSTTTETPKYRVTQRQYQRHYKPHYPRKHGGPAIGRKIKVQVTSATTSARNISHRYMPIDLSR